MPGLRCILCLLGLMCCTNEAAAQGQNPPLYIVDHAFVLRPGALQEPADSERLASPMPQRPPLVLWTKLAGDIRGIERLAEGGFHLYHKWTVTCEGVEADFGDEVQHERRIDVDGRESWTNLADSLKNELSPDLTGEFDWRTASEKSYVPDCSYLVEVVDEAGTPLHCSELNGNCAFRFKVSGAE